MTPYNKLTIDEKLACISLYPEEAKKDEDWYIRLETYRALGFTEEALKDENLDIRREARIYFRINSDDELDKAVQLLKDKGLLVDGKILN